MKQLKNLLLGKRRKALYLLNLVSLLLVCILCSNIKANAEELDIVVANEEEFLIFNSPHTRTIDYRIEKDSEGWFNVTLDLNYYITVNFLSYIIDIPQEFRTEKDGVISYNDPEILNYFSQYIESMKSSDENIFKIKSNNKFKVSDSGACYIDVKVKESQNTKAFILRVPVIVKLPCVGGGYTPQNNINKAHTKRLKNTLLFGYLVGPAPSSCVGEKSKCRVEIAKDKKFEKIVKSYTLKPKYFNNQKKKTISNIKRIGLKKNRTYYVRAYVYKKKNGVTFKSDEYYCDKIKVTKDYKIKNSFSGKKYKKWSYTETVKNNPSFVTVAKSYGIDYDNYTKFNSEQFYNLYTK